MLESDPGSTSAAGGAAGTADYREVGPEDVRIRAEAAVPSILVVRNAWDEGWSATLDGRAVPVLRTDGFLQGVSLPPGRHEVRLTYREPAIARGLALSALAWLGFLGVLTFEIVRSRRARDQERRDLGAARLAAAAGASLRIIGIAAPTGSTGPVAGTLAGRDRRR